jgi:tetratricopeptide (TPR) repeat protein
MSTPVISAEGNFQALSRAIVSPLGETPKLKIFISYSRRDASEFARELLGGLRLAGYEPKLDIKDIAKGEEWETRLSGLILEADTVVYVITPESVKSIRCDWEIKRSLALSKRIVPVVWLDVDESAVPTELKRLNYTYFSNGRSFTEALEELAAALRVDVDWIREHTRIGELAARWHAENRPESLLLRGDQIELANRWVKRRKTAAPEITEAQRAFLNTSVEEDTVRTSKERRQLEEMIRVQSERQTALDAAEAHRRRKNWVVGGAFTVVSSLAILFYLARIDAERSAQLAMVEKARAVRSLALANGTANDLVFELAQQFRRLPGVPQSVTRDVLQRSLKLLEDLPLDDQSSPQARRTRAVALGEMARSLQTVDQLDNARKLSAASLDILAELGLSDPTAERRYDLSIAEELLAGIETDLGSITSAMAHLHAANATRRAIVAAAPAKTSWQEALAISLDNLGRLLLLDGKTEAATQSFREAVRTLVKVVEQHPKRPETQTNLAAREQSLAGALMLAGQYVEAAGYLEGAEARLTKAVTRQHDTELKRELAFCRELRGELATLTGDTVGAIMQFRSALDLREDLTRGDPHNNVWQLELTRSLQSLGDALLASGDVEASREHFNRAFENQRRQTSRIEKEETLRNGAPGRETGEAYIALSWSALLARDFNRANETANVAAKLMPDDPWPKLHTAHALLFLGQQTEASNIYQSTNYRRNFSSTRIPRAASLQNDFEIMRRAGLDHPAMALLQKTRTAAGERVDRAP